YFRRNIRSAERETRRAVGLINAHYQESLSGIRVIHAFGQETNSLKNLEKQTERFLVAINRSGLYASYFGPLMDFLKGVASVGVVWAVARAMGLSQAISAGVLVAFLHLVSRLFTPLTALSDEYQAIQRALAGTERINELLAMPMELRPDLNSLTRRVSGHTVIRGLEAGYVAGRPVLRDINLDVPPGQRIAIVGRTGAGKTSLLNLLAGVYAPWKGTITIDGIDPRSLRPEDRRRLLGVVPQAIHIFEGSIRENITLGDATIGDDEVQHVAQIVGLHELIISLPDGYDTQIGSGGANLSHGQEQLLSLARALVCQPAVLLLDEPTSGLDTETERCLFAAIREESRQRTTITVSHRLSGVMDAERVIVMARGSIVQDGSPEQLANEDGWYAMMTALETLGWQSEVVPGSSSA
ncbi:MAG: ABC transporter ATP-binding protein, partial [Bacillota bacterium]|nr:ABC transporter ATP-binding protein [Bacillota bacterium]